MGSGKSTLARLYGARIGADVFDTDEAFTARYGDISAFFKCEGEKAFREKEHDIVVQVADSDAKIISCGGGVVLDKRNMNALRKSCDIVYLTAPIEVLKERIGGSSRPLGNDIERIVKEREHLYRRYADYTIDTSCGDCAEKLSEALSIPRPNRYDILLCDSDDTLLDFQKAMRHSIIKAAHSLGLKSADEKVIDVYSKVLPTVWGELERGEITRAQLGVKRFVLLSEGLGECFDCEKMNEAFMNEMATADFVLDGAIGFLTQLRTRGIKAYIITNSFTRIAKYRLRVLDPYVDGIFISEEIGYNKPDVRFFEHVYKDIGEPNKNRVLVFGDGISSDIAGGNAFDVDTCLFDPAGQKQALSDYAVKGYDELLCLL